MKRLIPVILFVTLVLSSLTGVSALADEENLTRARAVTEIVNALYSSGEETGFSLEDSYCLHPDGGGYVHFVPAGNPTESSYPVLCEVYDSVESSGFSDISEEGENLSVSIPLAKAMGIINGYGNGTFRPDKLVTYGEAVKMLVCAFGFSALAETRGGYPNGYIKAAEEVGITANSDPDAAAAVSPADFDAMLKASLDIPSMVTQNLMAAFTLPGTAEDCAEAYAEAVKNRNGALQYALYDDALKAATRDDFTSFSWVTGVSSPWVSGFQATRIGDLEFEVVFEYATSTGPGGSHSVRLLLCEISGGYRITGVE